MQLMAKIETLEASQQSLAREARTGAQARQDEAGEKAPEEAGRAAGASARREQAEPLRGEHAEASPEDTASSSSWGRRREGIRPRARPLARLCRYRRLSRLRTGRRIRRR